MADGPARVRLPGTREAAIAHVAADYTHDNAWDGRLRSGQLEFAA
ncbi:hypothetical protein MPS_1800 [Mycobacterium pseudoshottsii JCM 15466]|nr:hypothetical protein MMSP_5078 [Mycobacterium sp. 012931]EPQ70152.1 hypothetical protein MMEU_4591 [Mycobacterium marinum str. Europe]EPQ73701.1 hypothetical protein MMMB2_4473 [Mycobacterium marinum MB2]GAQ33745.1 hypothetical protein MPS_1800 [Mycobacterium pseudoshottsii JCM 15466]